MMAGRSAGVDLFNRLDTLFQVGVVGELSDGQLLERFLAGRDGADQAAFTSLVERHGPMVLDVCHQVLRDAHDAQDAFQATFLVLARRADSVHKSDSVASWLHGVALRIAARARVAAARRRVHERRAAAMAAARVADDGWSTESWPALHEEIIRLPRHYREPVVLCYLEGLSTEEAAARIGCPRGTVLSRLSRARERLRERLIRRGMAPGAMGLTLPALAALSRPLLIATVRNSLGFAGRRATEAGLASAAPAALAKGWLRAMMLSRWKVLGTAALSCVLAMCGLRSFGRSDDPPGGIPPEPAAAVLEADPRPADETGVELSGVVRMPDGSAAAGAIVQAIEPPEMPPIVARTDRDGRFRLRGVFGNGARLYVHTEDGAAQMTRIVDEPEVRSIAGRPIELDLAPAVLHEVVVLAGGRPAEGAQVVASGRAFRVLGVTGPDGKVTLRIPADDRLDEVHAWHRRLGVCGVRDRTAGLDRGRTELALLPPGPLWIRAVDPDDRPIPNLRVSPSFCAEGSDYAIVYPFEGARVRTKEDGTAIVPWAPRERLQFVDPHILDPEWKLDESDLQRTGDPVRNRVLTIRARRLRAVGGHIVMPEGASPEGLLVTGLGFGPRNTGDIPYARARADGTFTLHVASQHAYVLGIADSQWACDLWSGVILADDASRPPEVRLSAYRATPVTIRVTRGERRAPVVDAWVEVGNRGEVKWVDPSGKDQTGTAGLHLWVRTDARGVARAGAGRGTYKVRLSSGEWNEERTITVSSNNPIEVEFHRAWEGKRQATGRLLIDGKPFRPSPGLVARAWTSRPSVIPTELRPVVKPDGTFRADFDAENLSLFFSDPECRRTGFVAIERKESSVDVNMVPMASDSGILRDPDGRPLAGLTLAVFLKTAAPVPVAIGRSDASGRFRFPAVPARVPVSIGIPWEERPTRPDLYTRGADRLFETGEVRENDSVGTHRIQAPGADATPARPAVPLAVRIDNTCRNAGPAGMRVLVVLRGEEAKGPATSPLVDRWLDTERSRVIRSFLPVRAEPAETRAEAAALRGRGWPAPEPGQVALIVLDGDGKTIAKETIQAEPPDAALEIGDAFLKQHSPPAHDARAALAAARDEARKTGRRVWVVHGGPRCGPCFRLGRWIDEHRARLEKDFVVVKVMEGIDLHADEVIKQLPEIPGDGIPWHAFTEPDGTILATSRGPLGNIGFPGPVEGLRHFRRMLDRASRKMSPADVEALIESLAPKP